MSLPQALYTAEQSRQLDALATASGSPDGYALMCRAGQACLTAIAERWSASSLDIVCGAGNNAGDGYVLARLARECGMQVAVFALTDPQRLNGEAGQAYADFTAAGGVAVADLPDAFSADVVVDALLGTGIGRPVSGLFAAAVALINASGKPVLAVDIPSGLCADTGVILGDAVGATLTLSFIGLKQGLFTADGTEVCGEVVLDNLGVKTEAYHQVSPGARLLDERDIAAGFKPRGANAHKGSFGRLLLVGGDCGMPGAIRLAGAAALRCGAGVVQIATHPEHAAGGWPLRPELMVAGVGGPEDLQPLLDAADVVAVGPGLGTGPWGQSLWHTCRTFEGPLVVDADALNLLAAAPEPRDQWVLTPHPGELGRLLGRSAGQVQVGRFAAAREAADRFAAVVVAKGAGTLIDDGSGVRVCRLGNPGMATAGMGDVLTGVVAGLWAQGFSVLDSACLGVAVHAAAGDRAASHGQRGLLAMDVVEELRGVVNPCS